MAIPLLSLAEISHFFYLKYFSVSASSAQLYTIDKQSRNDDDDPFSAVYRNEKWQQILVKLRKHYKKKKLIVFD